MNKSLLVREAKSVYEWGRRNGGDEELSCWCAITAFELFRRFRRQKLNPTFFYVTDGYAGHCFVQCLGYIVDVTAKQFVYNLNNIEVRKTNPDNYWFWKTEDCEEVKVNKSHSTRQIQKLLKDWPNCQNPFKVDFKKDWA